MGLNFLLLTVYIDAFWWRRRKVRDILRRRSADEGDARRRGIGSGYSIKVKKAKYY